MIGKFDWTQEGAVEDLKLQWAQGVPCPDIAESLMSKFTGPLSRNSIIGKVTRLKLPCRRVKADPNKPKRQRSKQRNDARPFPFKSPIQTEEPHEPLRELCADDTPLDQRKQLFDLKEDDCCWPYGDVGKPDFFFCGGEVHPGESYCRHHCVIAYPNWH